MAESTRHSSIELIADACTSCMLCVRECPTWCISLESHTESVSEPGDRRPKSMNVLDAFTIDFGLCMYCGICVEVCPFDALHWQGDTITPGHDRRELALGIASLAPRR